jgi:lipid II:glycine glycyltransferase (peptidoglycan interpeptide bridge formation enzyme)
MAFRLEDGKPLLALKRRTVSGRCFTYIPWPEYNDVLPESRGQLLEELAGALAPHMPDECMYIRFDLPWETPYSAGENSADFDTADGRPPQRIRELRMNFGTREKNLRKAPTDVQPADTLLLDTARDRERLLREMKPKTRYNIRLSMRRGIRVREEDGGSLESWYEMYARTAERKGITLHDYRNFEALLTESRRTDAKNGTGAHLLMAYREDGGDPLAGIILLRRGDYMMYLYGASSGEAGSLMPTYALQWEAIRLAQSFGCTTYDLFGIPPTDQPSHPMHGLYRFKRGFGGKTVHRQGCWDYPIDIEAYERNSGAELVGPSYHAG